MGKASFGETLKGLREAAGMSQASLAVSAGLTAAGIAKIEQGLRPDPQWSTVVKLAAALGVDCSAFSENVAGEPVAKPAKRKAGKK